MAVAGTLFRRRVVHEHDAPSIRADVEHLRIEVGARQFVRRTLEQVGAGAGVHIHPQQMHHTPHRQVLVPVAVVAIAGGIAAFAPFAEFRVLALLRFHTLESGPHPGEADHVPAVRHPLECFHPGGDVADPPRLAAIGRDDIELGRFIHLPGVFTLADKGDAVAPGRPCGLAILVAAGRQRSRRAAQGREQPQLRHRLVGLPVIAGDGTDGLAAVGGKGRCGNAFEFPEGLNGERGFVFEWHGMDVEWAGGKNQGGRARNPGGLMNPRGRER